MTLPYPWPREPYCEHTLLGHPHQPASWCQDCKDGPELAAWHAYWDAKPYEWIWDEGSPDQAFRGGRMVERVGSGLTWADEGPCFQQVDEFVVYRRPSS